ncbi:MAG: hypothetical protein LBT40_04705 [Deltaproteobacteria bacterium]|nr:hypothetical protein [Deltaproteobacteria bacterium]
MTGADVQGACREDAAAACSDRVLRDRQRAAVADIHDVDIGDVSGEYAFEADCCVRTGCGHGQRVHAEIERAGRVGPPENDFRSRESFTDLERHVAATAGSRPFNACGDLKSFLNRDVVEKSACLASVISPVTGSAGHGGVSVEIQGPVPGTGSARIRRRGKFSIGACAVTAGDFEIPGLSDNDISAGRCRVSGTGYQFELGRSGSIVATTYDKILRRQLCCLSRSVFTRYRIRSLNVQDGAAGAWAGNRNGLSCGFKGSLRSDTVSPGAAGSSGPNREAAVSVTAQDLDIACCSCPGMTGVS